MINNLLQKLNYIQSKLTDYEKYLATFQQNLDLQSKFLSQLEKELLLNKESKDLYSNAVEVIYNQSLGQLQETINKGLKYIFFDKQYQIKFEIGDRRNKTLKILLIDTVTNKTINLKTGAGAGVRSVISFIFLVYYLLSKNSFPVLFLDESYSEISAEYVENFFTFIQALTKEKHFIIVMITHDDRFVNYSDTNFRILDGNIINN